MLTKRRPCGADGRKKSHNCSSKCSRMFTLEIRNINFFKSFFFFIHPVTFMIASIIDICLYACAADRVLRNESHPSWSLCNHQQRRIFGREAEKKGWNSSGRECVFSSSHSTNEQCYIIGANRGSVLL